MAKIPNDLLKTMNDFGHYSADQLEEMLGTKATSVRSHEWHPYDVITKGPFSFFKLEAVKQWHEALQRKAKKERAAVREAKTRVVFKVPKSAETLSEMQLELMAKLDGQITQLREELKRLSLRLDRDDGVRLAEAEVAEEREARKNGHS